MEKRMVTIWLTDIYNDEYNAIIFDDITEDMFLNTAVNKKGEVRSGLLQDTIQKDHITRTI